MFLSKYEKKRPSLHSYFFERNPNLRSDFKNSHFEILAFLYLTPTFDPPGLSQKFWKLYFLKFYQYWLGISNRILHKWISHQQKLRKKMCLLPPKYVHWIWLPPKYVFLTVESDFKVKNTKKNGRIVVHQGPEQA